MGQTAALCAPAIPLARFYAKNRRDGAVLGTLVCFYWWSCYRRLES